MTLRRLVSTFVALKPFDGEPVLIGGREPSGSAK